MQTQSLSRVQGTMFYLLLGVLLVCCGGSPDPIDQADAASDGPSTDPRTDAFFDATPDSTSSDATPADSAGSDTMVDSSRPAPVDSGSVPQCPDMLPAFPDAEGWGASSRGGRGGRVIYVTNTNDAGAGSFREALLASGPRIVIFRVSGYITLESTITLSNPFITIAGQSAPGGGVTIRMNKSGPSRGYMMRIAASDVIIQNMRFRRGRADAPGCCDDNIETEPTAERLIIDRSSFSWSQDGQIDLNGRSEITVQRCILSEALLEDGGGAPRSGKALAVFESERISIHHNLLAHNYSRNPRLDSTTNGEVINNVIYDYISFGLELSNNYDRPLRSSLIGNYFRPSTNESPRFEILMDPSVNAGSVYVEDNFDDAVNHPNYDPADAWAMVGTCQPGSPTYCRDGAPVSRRADSRFALPPIPVTVQAASTLPGWLEGNVGALPTDSVDSRVFANVRNRTGETIADENDVGGYPTIAGGTPYPDADMDGMDDNWETDHGLTLGDDDSAEDSDDDGYTNLEEFLNDTSPNVGCRP